MPCFQESDFLDLGVEGVEGVEGNGLEIGGGNLHPFYNQFQLLIGKALGEESREVAGQIPILVHKLSEE